MKNTVMIFMVGEQKLIIFVVYFFLKIGIIGSNSNHNCGRYFENKIDGDKEEI